VLHVSSTHDNVIGVWRTRERERPSLYQSSLGNLPKQRWTPLGSHGDRWKKRGVSGASETESQPSTETQHITHIYMYIYIDSHTAMATAITSRSGHVGKLALHRTIASFRDWRRAVGLSRPDTTIGLVPTMGALHEGAQQQTMAIATNATSYAYICIADGLLEVVILLSHTHTFVDRDRSFSVGPSSTTRQ
jgi:hypothetical protein